MTSTRNCVYTARARATASTGNGVESNSRSAHTATRSPARMAELMPNHSWSPARPSRACCSARARWTVGCPRRSADRSITSSWISAKVCRSSRDPAAMSTPSSWSAPAARWPQYTNAGRSRFPPDSTSSRMRRVTWVASGAEITDLVLALEQVVGEQSIERSTHRVQRIAPGPRCSDRRRSHRAVEPDRRSAPGGVRVGEPRRRCAVARSELADLGHRPRAEGVRSLVGPATELLPRHPAVVIDLERVRRRVGIDDRRDDGAQLVLDHSVVHHGAIREVVQQHRQPPRGQTQLVLQAPGDGLAQRLAGGRMTAAAVGPHRRPRQLDCCPLRDQHLAGAVDDVAREAQVARRVAVVDGALRRRARHLASGVDEDHPLLHRQRPLDRRSGREAASVCDSSVLNDQTGEDSLSTSPRQAPVWSPRLSMYSLKRPRSPTA